MTRTIMGYGGDPYAVQVLVWYHDFGGFGSSRIGRIVKA